MDEFWTKERKKEIQPLESEHREILSRLLYHIAAVYNFSLETWYLENIFPHNQYITTGISKTLMHSISGFAHLPKDAEL